MFILFPPFYFQYLYLSPFSSLNRLQTELTLKSLETLLSLLHIPAIPDHAASFSIHEFRLIIEDACNGFGFYLLLASAIMAYGASVAEKISWLLVGYLFVMFVNLLRLLFIVYMVSIDPDLFRLSHDVIGRYGMLLSVFVLYFIFVKTTSADKKDFV
ncbi:exosortase/archaeosortase family protein [Hydrogenimonas sp.]